MKIGPAHWMVFLSAFAVAGCVDGNTARRDDGRYVVAAPFMSPSGKVNVVNDRLPSSVLPGEAGPGPDYTVVPAVSPKEQKRKDTQDKFEEDLADLGKK